jgi:hypothetical protein
MDSSAHQKQVPRNTFPRYGPGLSYSPRVSSAQNLASRCSVILLSQILAFRLHGELETGLQLA